MHHSTDTGKPANECFCHSISAGYKLVINASATQCTGNKLFCSFYAVELKLSIIFHCQQISNYQDFYVCMQINAGHRDIFGLVSLKKCDSLFYRLHSLIFLFLKKKVSFCANK